MLGQEVERWKAEDIILFNAFSEKNFFWQKLVLIVAVFPWAKTATDIEKCFPPKANTLEDKCSKQKRTKQKTNNNNNKNFSENGMIHS